MEDSRFHRILLVVLASSVLVRVAYVVTQPGVDPAFDRPMLDGAYYWEWARALARGETGPAGAYYLAPLYPHLQALIMRVAGESFAVLYLLQHLMTVAAAGLIALGVRSTVGAWAALAGALLMLTYHPTVFFASRPIGEPLALLLLGAALASGVVSQGRPGSFATGILAGLASLARPNLLLVPACWSVEEAFRRRFVQGLMLVVGVGLVLVPVLLRNLAVSGHPVPISANAGMTLYHGNGPGADGVGSLPPEISGSVLSQQAEATRVARLRSGLELDDVEADRWWGREALRVRLADPLGSLGLGLRRLALSAANAELSLDYTPSLDRNPWRFFAPMPFALILGLAAAGVVSTGFRGTGGARVWLAILATVATPVLFYVSSRYRLPTAMLLCVPAGVGLVTLVGLTEGVPGRRRYALGTLLAVLALSVLVPTGALMARGESIALANRAVSWRQQGDVGAAERDLRTAIDRDPTSAIAWFGLGRVQQMTGRGGEAEASYRRALELNPGSAEAAGNLAQILIDSGRPSTAVPLLVRALERRPLNEVCWVNLIVALVSMGDQERAVGAIDQAMSLGIALDPELVALVRGEDVGASSTDRRPDR